MRFLLTVLLIAFLSAGAEWLLPWWSAGIVCLLVGMAAGMRDGKAFLAGFAGLGLCWLLVALVRDSANEHILSTRMAALFHLPHYSLFLVVTVLIGGLAGGLSAWAGALLRSR